LEFKSPSDRKIIGVLKALKFIGDDGVPTERNYAFGNARGDGSDQPRAVWFLSPK
jgi:hypothetical protein